MFQKPISLTFIRSFIRSFVYEEIQQCDALTISMDNNVRSKLTFSFLVKSFNFPLPFIIHKQLNMSSLLSRRGVNLRCRKMNAQRAPKGAPVTSRNAFEFPRGLMPFWIVYHPYKEGRYQSPMSCVFFSRQTKRFEVTRTFFFQFRRTFLTVDQLEGSFMQAMKGKLLVTIIQSNRFASHCASESVQTKPSAVFEVSLFA